MRRPILALLLTLAGFAAAAQGPAAPDPAPHDPTPDAPVQGWTRSEREIIWNSPVGSRLIPYPWLAALDAPGTQTPFAARLATYGFLPAQPGPANPGALPIGLSRERDRTDGLWLGLTCAACHTARIAYGTRTVQLEGAGSALDADAFTRDLLAALAETEADPARFTRFADRLGTPDPERPALHARVENVIGRPRPTSGHAGPGRFDFRAALAAPGAAPNAPVRNPALWNNPGTLPGNIDQVLATGGTPDTVSLPDLRKIEALLRRLQPPPWPAIFPPIDRLRATRGAATFAISCAACHASRPGAPRPLIDLAALGTDPAAALAPPPDPAVAAAIAHFPTPPAAPPLRPAYRAPALAGIWAGAPYLHDGAVPNLQQLLTPPSRRVATFSLVPAAYDPEAVGLPATPDPAPRFDTTQPGNRNTGHLYGTDLPEDARRDLLEYLKTL